MRLNKIKLSYAVTLLPLLAFGNEPMPPDIQPYQIPTFGGEAREFKLSEPIKPAPRIDGDAIFKAVVACFPERVQWGLELDAVAGARATDGGVSTFDTAGLAKYYAGVVAKMPLYSATELTAERTKEYQRRQEVAANVSALLKAVADRRRAERELGLFASLEARSQKRVYLGVAEAVEQVTYLEKVAKSQSDLDAAHAAIEGARLALVGQCRDEVADDLNGYLLRLVDG